jgi:hypothetical protein
MAFSTFLLRAGGMPAAATAAFASAGSCRCRSGLGRSPVLLPAPAPGACVGAEAPGVAGACSHGGSGGGRHPTCGAQAPLAGPTDDIHTRRRLHAPLHARAAPQSLQWPPRPVIYLPASHHGQQPRLPQLAGRRPPPRPLPTPHRRRPPLTCGMPATTANSPACHSSSDSSGSGPNRRLGPPHPARRRPGRWLPRPCSSCCSEGPPALPVTSASAAWPPPPEPRRSTCEGRGSRAAAAAPDAGRSADPSPPPALLVRVLLLLRVEGRAGLGGAGLGSVAAVLRLPLPSPVVGDLEVVLGRDALRSFTRSRCIRESTAGLLRESAVPPSPGSLDGGGCGLRVGSWAAARGRAAGAGRPLHGARCTPPDTTPRLGAQHSVNRLDLS